MRRPALYFTLLLISGILFYACKKGSIETNYNPSLKVANNHAIAERAYADIFNIFFRVISDSALRQQGSKNVFGAECTYTETNSIKYVIDFLPYFTTCPDGKSRKGKITATLNKKIYEAGAVASLTFEDYNVDDLKLQGNNSISNEGLSAAMLQVYRHEAPDVMLTFIDSLSFANYYWNSDKIFTFAEGMGTPGDFSDDMFLISGTSSGKDVNGTAFSAATDEPLGDYFDCRWIRTGITLLSIPSADVTSGYIDYIGEDTCTNQVMYYFNGNPFYDRFERY